MNLQDIWKLWYFRRIVASISMFKYRNRFFFWQIDVNGSKWQEHKLSRFDFKGPHCTIMDDNIYHTSQSKMQYVHFRLHCKLFFSTLEEFQKKLSDDQNVPIKRQYSTISNIYFLQPFRMEVYWIIEIEWR